MDLRVIEGRLAQIYLYTTCLRYPKTNPHLKNENIISIQDSFVFVFFCDEFFLCLMIGANLFLLYVCKCSILNLFRNGI